MIQFNTYPQHIFKTEHIPVHMLSILFAFTQQHSFFIKKQMSLHGSETNVFNFFSFMFSPNIKTSLHQ